MSNLEFADALIGADTDDIDTICDHFKYRYGGTWVSNDGRVLYVDEAAWNNDGLCIYDGEDTIPIDPDSFMSVPPAIGNVQYGKRVVHATYTPGRGYKYGLDMSRITWQYVNTSAAALVHAPHPGGWSAAVGLFNGSHMGTEAALRTLSEGRALDVALSTDLSLCIHMNRVHPVLVYRTWNIGYVDDNAVAHVPSRLDHLVPLLSEHFSEVSCE